MTETRNTQVQTLMTDTQIQARARTTPTGVTIDVTYVQDIVHNSEMSETTTGRVKTWHLLWD